MVITMPHKRNSPHTIIPKLISRLESHLRRLRLNVVVAATSVSTSFTVLVEAPDPRTLIECYEALPFTLQQLNQEVLLFT